MQEITIELEEIWVDWEIMHEAATSLSMTTLEMTIETIKKSLK
jgi:hypothetical protein